MRNVPLWCRVLGLVISVLDLTSARLAAQTSEHFFLSSFTATAGEAPTVLNFDSMTPHNNGPTMVLDTVFGVTATNRTGAGLNIVQAAPNPAVPNFVAVGQIASLPNVLSSGHFVATANPNIADDVDFDFAQPVRAAGLWIGSLGGGSGPCLDTPTFVQFLDTGSVVIASEQLTRSHIGVIPGRPTFPYENKIFYGVVSVTPIKKIRVFNSAADACDVISFDDVQFVPFPEDSPPVADAGLDISVNEGQSPVTLDGSGSQDPDGDALTYFWEQLAGGTSVTLSNPLSAQPTFTAPLVAIGGETLTFQLTVTASGVSVTDTASVTIVNVNHTPVADAGTDQSVAENSPVTLHGDASFDSDGDSLTYLWTQVGGAPVISLSGANTKNPTFTAPLVDSGGAPGVVATLVFELRVDDGFPMDAPAPGFAFANVVDLVTIQVTNVNNPPAANAGPDGTADEQASVSLDATASNDPDSDSLGYSWSQIDGPAVVLVASNTAVINFIAPYVPAGGADLSFQVTVDDGFGGTSMDTAVVHVQNVNDPPLAAAARPTIASLWPPNHGFVKVGIVGVSDPNNNAFITVTGVTQDEPTSGLGDGDTQVDAVINADGTVLLRAERAGTGNGRVYRISFTASDPEGSSSGEVFVSVPHSAKKPAVDSGQLFDATQ